MNQRIESEIGFWIGIVCFILAIGSIWYSKYLARRSERQKRLVLDVGPSVPLVSIFPENTGIKLSVTYEREGIGAVQVRSVYLTFARIGNLGREPVRAEDTVINDPLTLMVEGTPVLDIATVETTRPVIQFQLDKVVMQQEQAALVGLKFAFLDYQDGALIRILTEKANPEINLQGTIIGQPGGIDRKNYFEAAQWGSCGFMFSVILIMLASVLIVPAIIDFFHWHVSDGVKAISIAGFITAYVGIGSGVSIRHQLDKETRGEWPKKLSLPYWFSDTYSRDQRSKSR